MARKWCICQAFLDGNCHNRCPHSIVHLEVRECANSCIDVPNEAPCDCVDWSKLEIEKKMALRLLHGKQIIADYEPQV